ncbi:hypothetical protein [Cronobacter dublinensis]|uniref:hypothetical protein n=1 Tax=Cronobacter dublinensis TaxID=413497 RepID=UPI00192A634B|nr:hypothetical protein [Cronobacter dublinensis]ELY4007483.1 hypothetical protein [Cronobacter dublinensis]ELY4408828.1 hypothetical protein [Cronobacter dublinensis]ELY5820812.1 hypothetical protein [Cronobacter dublinensis]
MSDKNKRTQPENYGFYGYFLLIIGFAGLTALLLFIFKEQYIQHGWSPTLCWAIWGCVFSGLFFGLLIMKFWWPLKQGIEQLSFRPGKPGQPKSASQAAGDSHVISEIIIALRQQYGPLWPRKVRILLVTGNINDVEQLTPKLPRERWQEDQGTLLLWGGDIREEAELAWFTALRKLRRRPIDGVIWVTSAFDDQTENDDASVTGPLSPDAMDALAHALHQRYEALGWRIPVYR